MSWLQPPSELRGLQQIFVARVRKNADYEYVNGAGQGGAECFLRERIFQFSIFEWPLGHTTVSEQVC